MAESNPVALTIASSRIQELSSALRHRSNLNRGWKQGRRIGKGRKISLQQLTLALPRPGTRHVRTGYKWSILHGQFMNEMHVISGNKPILLTS